MTPKIVFIVPYRDRHQHLNVFRVMMTHIMEDYEPDSYEIYFAHQKDQRPFNRGAMKNIGFKAIRDKYPNTYQNITFVFNDVDTVPSSKGLLNYETTRGVIKHFYGVSFALGGIFSITGYDFEKINGFPCYWSWGYEDNVINTRAMKAGIMIDRSQFFKMGDHSILQSVDSYVKSINRRHKDAMRSDDGRDGINTITNIKYNFEYDYKINPSSVIGSFIHIDSFEPIHKLSDEVITNYDFINKRFIKNTTTFTITQMQSGLTTSIPKEVSSQTRSITNHRPVKTNENKKDRVVMTHNRTMRVIQGKAKTALFMRNGGLAMVGR